MINIQNIDKQYGEKILFFFLLSPSWSAGPPGLVGPNGSGKTTLFRMIAGEEHPDRGEILLRKGAHIGFLSRNRRRSKGSLFWKKSKEG